MPAAKHLRLGPPTVIVATDASPRGCGIVCGNSWNAGHWSWLPNPLYLNIAVLELLPLLLFLRTHPPPTTTSASNAMRQHGRG